MEFRRPIITAGLTLLVTLSALTLFAASELRTSTNDELQYTHFLQSQLEQRSFLKRTWSKGKATPYLERADALMAEGKRKEAISILEIYLESDASHYLTQWKLLKLKLPGATPREALAASQMFLKHLPEFGPVLLIRANAYQQMQQYEQATDDFRAALNDPVLNDHDRFEARQALYYLTLRNGDRDEAFRQLKSLLATYPKSISLHREYATQLEQRNELEAAANAWNAIPSLSRNSEEIHASLRARASLLERLGQSDEALLLLEKVEQKPAVESGDWNHQLRFAQLYLKKEKYAQALKYLVDRDSGLYPASIVENNQQKLAYPTYLRMVADLALKLNRHPLAIEAISRLNQTSSRPEEKFRWLAMLGTLEQSDSHFEAALDYFERALHLKDDVSIRLQAAEVAWHLQRFDKVTALLQPASDRLQNVSQPERVKVQHRLCEALEKNGELQQALACTDKLLNQHPKDQGLLLSAADLAARAGDKKSGLGYLVTARSLERPTRTGIASEDQRVEKQRGRRSLEWFRNAYQQERSFGAGYAYASALLKIGQRDSAIIILSRLVNLDAPAEDKFKAHHALGYAMAANGDFVGAARSWQRADNLHPSHILKLRRTWALYSADMIDEASGLLAQVSLQSLPDSEQTTWYELRGMIRFRQKQFADSVVAREEVVRRSPTAKHWSQLAESYAQAGHSHKADNAYEKAIAVSRGDKSSYVLQRAYLKIGEKKYQAAQILLEQALREDPENPVIEEELGYAYARLHMNKQASEQFKLAINHYQADASSGKRGAGKVMEKRNRLSRNIARLDQGLKLSAYHSGNLAEVTLANSNAALIAPYRLANGGIEISYQPTSIGYRNGKQLQMYARSVWNSSKESIVPSHDSSSIGVGVRYKPLAGQDAWLSVERLNSTGDNSADNTLVRGTYQRTRGYDWPLDDRIDNNGSHYYSDLYLDIAKLLENDAPTLAYAEGRAGRSWILNDNWIAAPHAYVRGQTMGGDTDQRIIDAGVGISARMRGAYDFYEGYKSDSEFYLRLGQDIDNNTADEETRATLGLKLSY